MLNKKGYSIIELLIVIAIIGLIFELSLSFYKNNNINNFIDDDVYLLKTNIIKIENMTSSGQSNIKFSENNNYGIYLNTNNKNYYLLYKDSNLNNRYDASETFETVKIDNSIINSLSSGSTMDLLFNANGDVYLNNAQTFLTNINISFIYKTSIKNIYINSLTKTINIQ